MSTKWRHETELLQVQREGSCQLEHLKKHRWGSESVTDSLNSFSVSDIRFSLNFLEQDHVSTRQTCYDGATETFITWVSEAGWKERIKRSGMQNLLSRCCFCSCLCLQTVRTCCPSLLHVFGWSVFDLCKVTGIVPQQQYNRSVHFVPVNSSLHCFVLCIDFLQ